jgi:chromosome segregation ATPase
MKNKNNLPVTKNSSRAELWEELQAANSEIDAQQKGLSEAATTIDALRAENAKVREKLTDAYLRLNVIQAALAHKAA